MKNKVTWGSARPDQRYYIVMYFGGQVSDRSDIHFYEFTFNVDGSVATAERKG